MPTQKFTVIKTISELKLREELTEVYCYMDFNKQTIEPMYNDELKLPFSIIKMVQKQFPNHKMPTKKVFGMIKDVKVVWDNERTPDKIGVQIEMNF